MNLSLPALPYALDALEPHISPRTLAEHHGQHHAAYLEKTRSLVAGTALEEAELEEIVQHSAKEKVEGLFNVAAQAWNHAFHWQCMRPGGGGDAHGSVAKLIVDAFGSHKAFRKEYATATADQFGSGWVWLVLDGKRLRIKATANADTPLVTTQAPLLALDVWEHAYYLDYQHRRPDYIDAFLTSLIDWEFVNLNLSRALNVPAPASVERRVAEHQG